MYQILKYKSPAGEIEFKNQEPIILQNVDGLSETKVNNISTKYINQDGESYEKSNLEKKEISVDFLILADDQKSYMEHRNKILKVMNPKLGEGELTYEYGDIKRTIKVIPDALPSMPIKSGRNFAECNVILIANDPHFKGKEVKTQIAIWSPSFHFPLTFRDSGEIVGYREPSLIVNIFNESDVETPIRIEFAAKGNLINPSVMNVNTREYIKIDKNMVDGEKIIITTGFANKKVTREYQGITSNAFNSITLNSTFLHLYPGDNLIKYNADEGLDNLEVNIYHTPLYVGV